MLKTKKIGVLMGGRSSEREVSLKSGKCISEALKSLGYIVKEIIWGTDDDLAEIVGKANPDIVFNGLHGTYGEDGAVQGFLQCLGIPYTGSDIACSAMAMDKVISKAMFQMSGIPSAEWVLASPGLKSSDLPFKLPCVVKPSLEGSSVGVTIVKEAGEFSKAISEAKNHKGVVMVEEFIEGREICTSVLGDRVLGSGEITPKNEFYDYEAKYNRDDTVYTFPPDIDSTLLEKLERVALEAHQTLGCRGYSRVDFRVRKEEVFVLEINTLPGMTNQSLFPKAAELSGHGFPEICEKILEIGWQNAQK